MYTSSTQENGPSGQSFLSVYQSSIGSVGSQIQYSIAYGHVSGSGSAPFNQLVPGNTPTLSIYGQYKTLLYGDDTTDIPFAFGNMDLSKSITKTSINKRDPYPGPRIRARSEG